MYLSGKNKHVEVLIDKEDLVYLKLHKWFMNRGGYAWSAVYNPITKKHETFRMHRMVFEARIGRRLSSNELIDHIDRNKLNNRYSNLRLSDKSTNAANSFRKDCSTTKLKGVTYTWCYKNGKKYKRTKPWFIQIKSREQGKYTAYHRTKEEAALDHDKKAYEWFGEFAYLNYPNHPEFVKLYPETARKMWSADEIQQAERT